MTDFRRRGILNLFLRNNGDRVMEYPVDRADQVRAQFDQSYPDYALNPENYVEQFNARGERLPPRLDGFEFMDMAIDDMNRATRNPMDTSLLVGYGDEEAEIPLAALSRSLVRSAPEFTVNGHPTNYLRTLGSVRPGMGTTIFHALRDFYPQTPLRLYAVSDARPFYERLGLSYLNESQRRNPNVGADMFMNPDDPLLRAEGGLVENEDYA